MDVEINGLRARVHTEVHPNDSYIIEYKDRGEWIRWFQTFDVHTTDFFLLFTEIEAQYLSTIVDGVEEMGGDPTKFRSKIKQFVETVKELRHDICHEALDVIDELERMKCN